MNKHSQRTSVVAGLCAEWREDDGVDPRYEIHPPEHTSHKSLQLCKQAMRVISQVLQERGNDELLSNLQIISVLPEQDGKLLCVTVTHQHASEAFDDQLTIHALKQIQGGMRYELAQSLHRKKVPRLSFRYIGVTEQGGL
jgi:ribosome-binding factor A